MDNISKKESWIGIGVAILALAVAIYFEPFIKDGMLQEIRTYQEALRVENDSTVFSYAQKTNVGNVLALGNLEAQQLQSIPELVNQYAVIQKVKEHYTEHTRTVCAGTDDDGNCTSWTTEDYYTWDTVQTWTLTSETYNFLGVTFAAGALNLPSYQRLALTTDIMAPHLAGFYDRYNLYEQNFLGWPSGDDRYEFRVLPPAFAATIFVNFSDGKTSQPLSGDSRLTVYESQTPAQVIQRKKADLIYFDVMYYFLAVVVIGVLWYWLAYSHLDIE